MYINIKIYEYRRFEFDSGAEFLFSTTPKILELNPEILDALFSRILLVVKYDKEL